MTDRVEQINAPTKNGDNVQNIGNNIENEEESPIIETTNAANRNWLGLLSPGLMMLFPALAIDLFCFILILFTGVDDTSILDIPDILGAVIIGGWIFFNSQGKRTGPTKRPTKKINKFIQNTWVKIFGTLGLEIIPWVGGLMPFWTITVILELTEPEEPEIEVQENEQNTAENPENENINSEETIV